MGAARPPSMLPPPFLVFYFLCFYLAFCSDRAPTRLLGKRVPSFSPSDIPFLCVCVCPPRDSTDIEALRKPNPQAFTGLGFRTSVRKEAPRIASPFHLLGSIKPGRTWWLQYVGETVVVAYTPVSCWTALLPRTRSLLTFGRRSVLRTVSCVRMDLRIRGPRIAEHF